MIGWHIRKCGAITQNHVTMISAEAEVIALVKCTSELLGVRSMMIMDWGREISGVVFADSSAALVVAKRKCAGKLRHINVSSLWIQGRQDREDLELIKVLGTENPIDMLTKNLAREAVDRRMVYLSQERVSGRARSGLKVQGGGENEEDNDTSANSRTHTLRAFNASANHPTSSLARLPLL